MVQNLDAGVLMIIDEIALVDVLACLGGVLHVDDLMTEHAAVTSAACNFPVPLAAG